MPTETHDAKLAQFLLQVLGQPNLRNGVFTGKGITKFSHPIFTEKPEGWHRRILLSELIAKGWIRFLGQSEYQVEQSFVDEHGLQLVINPRTKVSPGTHFNGAKPNGHAPEPESFESLLAQQAAIAQKIQDQVLSEQRRRQDAIAALRGQLSAAETDLAEFNVKYAELLASAPQA